MNTTMGFQQCLPSAIEKQLLPFSGMRGTRGQKLFHSVVSGVALVIGSK